MKIPFALKHGEFVSISDLSLKDRGLKCDCKCIVCGAPLVARMGQVNQHHFAHSGKRCDKVKVYTLGMYMLIEDILKKRKKILLPGLRLEYKTTSYTVNEKTVQSIAKVVPTGENTKNGYLYKDVTKKQEVSIDKVELRYKKEQEVDALILDIAGKELAITVALPSSICKRYAPKQYKEVPTLQLDFRNTEYSLETLTRLEVEAILALKLKHKNWIANDKIGKGYKEIIEENNNRVAEMMKDWEREMKHQASLVSLMKSRKHKQSTDNQAGKFKLENFDSESKEPTWDDEGSRWVCCVKCGIVAKTDDMKEYGGEYPNHGVCYECSE